MDTESFVQNVKLRCKAKGVSVTRACIESGAGRSLIDNVKRGQVPSVEKVRLLAEYLGVTTSELLGEEKTAPPEVGSGEVDLELWELLKRIPPERMPEVERYLRFQAGGEDKP